MDILDRLQHELDVSRFLADRGERPPALEVPRLGDVDRLLTTLSRVSRREFLTLHDAVASVASGEPDPVPGPAIVEHNRAMLRRGVAVREVITEAAHDRFDSAAALAAALDRDGGQVGLVPAVPFKAAVADRSVAVLPLAAESKTFRLGVLVVRDAEVVRALHAAARGVLATARPLAGRPDGVPARLRPVLDALLDGTIDAAAARRLGVSPRTYTRRVAELLDLLGVTTRAQAGSAARKRGWVSD